jgi:hypothetical protein
MSCEPINAIHIINAWRRNWCHLSENSQIATCGLHIVLTLECTSTLYVTPIEIMELGKQIVSRSEPEAWLRSYRVKLLLYCLNWFMHPVARVSINKHRNLRTQQMLVHCLVCIFHDMFRPLLVAIFRWFVIWRLSVLVWKCNVINLLKSMRNRLNAFLSCWFTNM